MCKINEEMRNEAEYEKAIKTATNMLMDNVLTIEQIAKYSELPIEVVEELSKQIRTNA